MLKPSEKTINTALNIMEKLAAAGVKEGLTYQPECEMDYCKWFFTNANFLKEMGIDFFYGSTKVCLVSEKMKHWVIKLPIDRTADPFYKNKSYATIDFCNKEAEYYELACADDIGEFFAATYKIGEVDGINVYLQERVNTNSLEFFGRFTDSVEEFLERDEEESDEDYSYRVSEEVEYLDGAAKIEAVMKNTTSFERLCKLTSFVEDYDINDLHEENFGFSVITGRPVVIDFSGYSS